MPASMRLRVSRRKAVPHLGDFAVFDDDRGIAAQLLAWSIKQFARVDDSHFPGRRRSLLC